MPSLTQRIAMLESELSTIENRLKDLPKGILYSRFNGHKIRWFLRRDGATEYLPKRERPLAEKLALRKYLELRLREAGQEVDILKELDSMMSGSKASEQLLMDPCYRDLLAPILKPPAERYQLWEKDAYPKNPLHPEALVHMTPAGYKVRSKSEAMISMLLTQAGIPHRYECGLSLNNRTIYPDFTVINPVTSQVYYWEHLGMLDDPSYRRECLRKLDDYMQAGIYPGIQLILTTETSEHPLSYTDIQNVISQFLS